MVGNGEGIAALRSLSDAGLAFSFLGSIRSRRTQETGIQPALGNFELGNTSRCRSSARTDIHSCRTSRDATASAGFKLRPQQERDVVAFVKLLRKCPSVIPRSPTAEMLKQLLKTSRKHSLRQSQVTIPLKKRRHHWDKPRPLESSTPYASASRYKENYRRLRRKKQANGEVDLKEKGYSVPGRRVSFDYLNSGARSSAEFVDTTIENNRLFKNVFRDIFRHKREPVTAFPVCPTIQDRYRKHLKKYHPTTSKTPYMDFENLAPCGQCLQKRPCACDTAKGVRRTVDKEEQAKRQFEDAIFSWLQDIPVYPNKDPRDKFTRDSTVKELAETLSGLKNGELIVKGKEEIKRALNKIPMWYPKGKIERDRFKNYITDNLLDKIKGIKELEKFYETIDNFFNDLQFLKKICKKQALDNIVTELYKITLNRPECNDMYRDLLKIKAFELLDRLPIQTSGNIYEYLNKLSDKLADRLIYISTKGMDEEKAKSEIKSLLNEKVSEDKLKDINEHVLTLSDRVKPRDSDIKQIIKEDIRDILDFSGVQIKNGGKVEEDLNKLVSDITTKGIEDDKAKRNIESLLKGKVSNEELKEITKRVLSSVSRIKPIDNDTKQIIKQDVNKILDLSGDNIKNKGTIEEILTKLKADITTKDINEEKANNEIKSSLNGKVPENKLNDTSGHVLTIADRVKPIDSGPKKVIKEDVCDTLDHPGICNYHKGKIKEDLGKLLNHIITEGMGEDKAKSRIESLLKEKIPKQKLKDITKRVLALADQVKLIDLETNQSFYKDVRILNISDSQTKNEEKVEERLSKLMGQISIKGMDEDHAETQIKSVLNSKVSDNKLENQKQVSKQVLSFSKQQEPTQVKSLGTLKNDLNDLHDEINVRITNREQVEKISHDIPSIRIMRGKDTNKAQDHIYDSLEQTSTSKNSQGTKTSFMPSTNHLKTSVIDWCEALLISDIDQGKKQDLANKIMLKIGEMNLNQDILNDDLLYDEILQDFIDQQISELQINKRITDTDKKALFEQIKKIKQKVQDDFISRKYKQQLHDTISNVLPVRANPTVEDVASFDLMKENLADTFINLNYSVDDDYTARNKFKRRIMDEVNKYVKDYLRRCPASPFNTKKLNEDLFDALINVPVPDDESMRTEVESMRMKDIINDWLKTLPMNKQSKSEQLHTNKIVTLMAQKLQELENEIQPNFEKIAVAEIALYLKKLPLKNKNNLHGMANKLVEKIKNTAESRAFVESRSNLTDDCLCEDFPMLRVPGKTLSLSCGLSIEDQEIMQQIRKLSLLSEAGTQSPRCRDAAVNPPPLDNESQTEMSCTRQYYPRIERPEHVCSKPASVQPDRTPIGSRPGPSAMSQSDLSPSVQVKEYEWDSCLDNKVETATQTPAEGSGIIFIPSSPITSECKYHPRSCTTPRRPVKPRSRPEHPTCQRPTPRRQLSSAYPNENFIRPKHCSRPNPILEREHLRSSCKHVGPSCGRMRSPCELCQENPATSRNRCAPMHVCPHPNYLYFK